MGKTSNAVKQKWNTKHYVQVKASVKPETAEMFKAACLAGGVSMAGELACFMESFANPAEEKAIAAFRVKTLKDRRQAMNIARALITEIRGAEEGYLSRIPINLHSSSYYERAEDRIDKLSEVLDAIDEIYDQ
jgi:hypothetical protein